VRETVRGTTIAIGGRGVLLRGESGRGKSDLALRLIDRGAVLVSDDPDRRRREGGHLLASAPATIGGKIEMRGVGIVAVPAASDIPICLVADLDAAPERLPPGPDETTVVGTIVPVMAVAALEASAALKVEAALRLYGLAP